MDLQNYYYGLSSDRLLFRKLVHNDIESWTDFYENNPNLKYLSIDLNRTNYEMAQAWIEAQLERYRKNEFGQLAMISKETGALIGTSGFSLYKFKGEFFLHSMSSVKPLYWRQGYSFEGGTCLYNFFFQNNLTDKIIAFSHIKNHASQKNLEKLGFKKQEQLYIKHRQVFFYVLTQESWENKQSIE
ncbi:MAG: GNAT family N-acetyltransferase [Chitinophagales bacterium]